MIMLILSIYSTIKSYPFHLQLTFLYHLARRADYFSGDNVGGGNADFVCVRLCESVAIKNKKEN